jgi:predicted dehydrogenase
MNRRNFLERAGLLGAGTLAGSVRGGAAARPAGRGPAGRAIRVGVITEPGGQHRDFFLRSLSICDGVAQVAVADRSGEYFEKARSLLGARAATYRTFREAAEMLARVEPELVLVVLEPVNTPPLVEAALRARAHVLVEKPGCVRLADFESLARLAEAGDRHVMLALTNRVSPAAVKARELVDGGWLGRLYGTSLHIVADQTRLKNPAYWKTWPASKARGGGGKLIYHGIHYVDLVQYVVHDAIDRVCGFTRNVGGQPIEVEDAAVLSLRFRGGMVGTLNAGFYLDRGYSTHTAVWGSEGWLRFDLAAGTPLQWSSTRPGAPAGVQTFAYEKEPDTYHRMLQAAVDAARGAAAAPITTAESLSVLRSVFAAYRAAETGLEQTVGG